MTESPPSPAAFWRNMRILLDTLLVCLMQHGDLQQSPVRLMVYLGPEY